MRILAIADVKEPWLDDYFDRRRLEGVELIISCGDLKANYLERIVTLANVPLVYVPGNHDTAYAEHEPEGCVNIDGHLREYKGLRLMGLGGSVRYNDRVYGYSEDEMRRRAARLALLAQASGGVDLLVTHAPARGHGDLDDFPHRGFECFNTLLERTQPALMLHGHVHMAYGRIERERVHECGTRIVNCYGSRIIEVEPQDREGKGLFKVKSLWQ